MEKEGPASDERLLDDHTELVISLAPTVECEWQKSRQKIIVSRSFMRFAVAGIHFYCSTGEKIEATAKTSGINQNIIPI